MSPCCGILSPAQNRLKWVDVLCNVPPIYITDEILCLCPRGVRAVSRAPDVPVGVGELGCTVQAFVIFYAQTSLELFQHDERDML